MGVGQEENEKRQILEKWPKMPKCPNISQSTLHKWVVVLGYEYFNVNNIKTISDLLRSRDQFWGHVTDFKVKVTWKMSKEAMFYNFKVW